MATSAFKSTSKRGTTIPSNSNTKILRRSRSVSAISRTKHHLNSNSSHQIADDNITSEFSNKRDNPLFFSNSSPPHETQISDKGTVSKAFGTTPNAALSNDERGRSSTRNSPPKTGIGRSLSRVRGRSVSRGHYAADESEKEEILKSSNSQKQSEFKQVANGGRTASIRRGASLTRTAADVRGRAKSSQTVTSQGQVTEYSEDDSACSLQLANWEDGISNGSMSEAEEKTTVHEQMKSVLDDNWRSDSAAGGIYETVRSEVRRAISDIQNDLENAILRNNVPIATTNVTDIPPDLVNPGAIELVLDIRREYTKKLEESEERARKLREDLAVEEHRGQELSRILKEILPEPKTSNSQRSRLRRRTSSERKNMSIRLTEEAMAYFDECVSISTFDSSDFSAPEDPPRSSVGTTNSVRVPGCFQQVNQSILAPYGRESNSNHRQIVGGYDKLLQGPEDSGLTANSSSDEPSMDQVGQTGHNVERNQQFLFSAAETPKEITGPHNDIRSYVKHFERDVNRDVMINAENRRSSYDADEYKLRGCLESFLFDKVFFKNRIESGSLHLCGGGLAISFSPFGPAF